MEISTLRILKFLFFQQLLFFLAMQHVGFWFPRPGIKPTPPAVDGQNLNHLTTKEVQQLFFKMQLLT